MKNIFFLSLVFYGPTFLLAQGELFSEQEVYIKEGYENLLSGNIESALKILEKEIFDRQNYDAVPYYRMAFCAASEEEAPKESKVKKATRLAKKAGNHWGASMNQKSLKKAFSRVKEKADKGDAVAQILLSFAYHCGCGTKKNHEKAFEYAESSAHLGLPCAAYAVSTYYKDGIGTEKDLEKAIEYATIALENNPHPYKQKYLDKLKKKLAKSKS